MNFTQPETKKRKNQPKLSRAVSGHALPSLYLFEATAITYFHGDVSSLYWHGCHHDLNPRSIAWNGVKRNTICLGSLFGKANHPFD
jgi:hypothetical protein